MATKIPSMTFTDFSLAGLDFFLTHESAKFAKGRKPDNFESHNSLKLSFTNVRDLHLNFAECETFRDSNSPAIVALCETNLDDSCNFSMTGYLPLIQKDFVSHMYGLAVYLKGLPFVRYLCQENSADSFLCFQQILLHSVSDHLLHLHGQFFVLFHLI